MFLRLGIVLILFLFFSVIILRAETVACFSGNNGLYPATESTADKAGIFSYIVIGAFIIFITAMLFYIIRLRKKLSSELIISKSISENAKAMIIICDSDGKVVLFNKFAREMTGHGPEDVKGRKINEIPFFSNDSGIGKQIYECTKNGNNMQNLEVRHTAGKNGKDIYVLWNIDVVKDPKSKKINVIAMGVDITDRKNTESKLIESYHELESMHKELLAKEIELKMQYDDLNIRDNELRRSEERYKLAVEGVNDGIWDWDGKDGKLFMSKRGRMIMGFDPEQEYVTMEEWFGVITDEDVDRFARSLSKYITGPQKKHFQIEYRIKTKDGGIKWIRTRGMAIWDENDIPVRVAGSITDITEQRLADEKIHQLAFYDSLTGLPNRTLLMDRFNVATAAARRKGLMVAVFFLDLDNFKTINDSMGHSSGDKLLMKVAEELRLKLRRSDTIARLGGDEFIILQTYVRDLKEVYRFASRLLETFKRQWTLNEREFYVTASIGISIYPDDGTDLQELMKNADAAMYHAKATGKNNFKVYTQELNLHIMRRMEIENQLRKAAERNEFVLHYQPQIELKTGKVVSVEALLRWSNPIIGWILPDSFIHVAEEIGLINNIGEWVLRTACKQLADWRSKGFDDLRVSINLSVRQFQQPNLVKLVTEIAEETGIRPEWLELEVTESLAMQNLEHTISVLEKFKEMGIGISLDDFGKGYSSLNYLKIMPINNLKIDKTFIHGIASNSKQAKIAKSLISLAHNMNLTVTAEGVENTAQLDFLIREGCDIAQGYLFSKPKPADELDLNTYEAFLPGRNK
ncbi:MAG: EAL domain-containing protein [Acetivibrionales bacterium]